MLSDQHEKLHMWKFVVRGEKNKKQKPEADRVVENKQKLYTKPLLLKWYWAHVILTF